MARSGLAEGGPLGFSDAAKRASDIINLHLVADPEGNIGYWVAIRLSDGGSDGVLYRELSDAVRAQLHYTQCMYVPIRFGGMPPQEADVMIVAHRRIYANGKIPPYLRGVGI